MDQGRSASGFSGRRAAGDGRSTSTVHEARNSICDLLTGNDDRALVVVGPCSIHDTKAAREYAGLLHNRGDVLALAPKFQRVVMFCLSRFQGIEITETVVSF